MDEFGLKPGEIVFCNLTLEHGKNTIVIEKQVYKNTDGFFHPRTKNDKLAKIKEPLKVKKVDIIVSLGFSNHK